MSFFTLFCMWLAILAVVIGVPYGAFLFWRHYLSVKTVGPHQIGAILHWGKLEDFTPSGRAFVPWFPVPFGKYYWYQLLLVPIDWFVLSYEGKEEHEIYSKDGVLLLVQATARVRFPFRQKYWKFLRRVVKSGVPFDKDNLKKVLEDEILSIVKDVLAEYGYEEATSGAKLTEINQKAWQRFIAKDSYFCQTGICGANPADLSPGSGEVVLRIERVRLTESMRQKRERVQTAKLDVEVAKSEAEAKALDAAVPGKAYAEWLATPEGQKADDNQKKQMLEIIRQRELAADGKYQEQTSRNVYGSPDGTPLPKSLTYLSLAGGGAGVFTKGNGKNRNKNKSQDDDE